LRTPCRLLEDFLRTAEGLLEDCWRTAGGVQGVLEESLRICGECNIHLFCDVHHLCHDQTFSRDHSHDRFPRDPSPDKRLAIKNFISSHKLYCPSKVRLETLSRFRSYIQRTFPPVMPMTEDPYHADPYHSYLGLHPLFYVSS